MPNASIRTACCTNVFVQREVQQGRIEVALADTATYSKGNASGMHLVTLFNGRRYEGVPGQDDFRVIEFSRARYSHRPRPEDLRGPHGPRYQAELGELFGLE